MNYISTGEIDKKAYKKFVEIDKLISEYLIRNFSQDPLNKIDFTIHYCPILMREELEGYFPARSRLDKKNAIFHCCPQLDFGIFCSDDNESCILNYVDGLYESNAALKKIGADKRQIDALRAILIGARVVSTQ